MAGKRQRRLVQNDPERIRSARSNRGNKPPQPTRTGRKLFLKALLAGTLVVLAFIQIQNIVNAPPQLFPAPEQGKDPGLIPASGESQQSETDPSLEMAIQTEQQLGVEETTSTTMFGPPNPFSWISVPIRKGDTLFGAVLNQGIGRDFANRIVGAIGEVFDVRKIQPGQEMQVHMFGPDTVVGAVFHPSPLQEIRLSQFGASLSASVQEIEPEIVHRAAKISVEGSLALSFQKAGLSYALLYGMAERFAWAIDFSNSVWPGDEVELLWEQLYVNGEPYRIGRILAARYNGKVVSSAFYHYQSEEGDAWFHEDGRNVRAAFLRAPLKFSRISSKFTRSRYHPVLKRYRPHSGVDFAAPTGTPVYSVADGIVVGASVMGGAGKAVRIRHNNGWITSYSHLSRILVKKGQRVRQKQRVGLVGSTGYSTGPHLDYRIKIGGKFVDPLHIKLPKGDPIPRAQAKDFAQRVETLQSLLRVELDSTAAGMPANHTIQ